MTTLTASFARTFKVGQIVVGPSLNPERKVRRWKILALSPSGDFGIGQNTRAKKEFLHPLDMREVKLED